MISMRDTVIDPRFVQPVAYQHFAASQFPTIHPVHWLHSHFAVGGWSPLQRLSGMLTAHMTRIAPHNGFTWHPHRGLEIYTWVLEGTVYHEDTTGGKGEIHAGELQRMFSGDYIEHMEMNYDDHPARVIQIWFAADPHYRGLPPHYQQLRGDQLPSHITNDATVYHLVGDDALMEQHMTGRLTATHVPAGGTSHLEPPHPGEDLFLYVTDGAGNAANGATQPLGQYDVIMATPDVEAVTLQAAPDASLDYLSFYLPEFLPKI